VSLPGDERPGRRSKFPLGGTRLSRPLFGGTCLSGPPSEGRACRVRCLERPACQIRRATLDYLFGVGGRDRHAPPNGHDERAPCMFKIAESMLKLVLVGWADPRRERSDRSGAARPVVRSSAPRSRETVSELDPGRFYGCRPNSHQGLCLWQARIDKEG